MADLRISDLVTASQLKNDDYYEIAQSESGTRVSYKTTLLAIAVQIATMVDFTSDLNTTSKKITGAINELKQLISLIPQFSIEVVQELPTEDISDTTIYLVPAEDPEVGNYYEEYIHVNNTWELVGTTAVDLSAYYTKLEVDAKFSALATVATSGSYNDLLNKPTLDVNETITTNPYTKKLVPSGQYTEKLKKIIGASVVWNQLMKNGNFADTSIWNTARVTLSVSNNVGSITLTDTNDPYIDQQFESLANHKYLYCAEVKRANSNANVRVIAYYNGTSSSKTHTTTTDNWEQVYLIVDNTTANNNRLRITEVGTKTVGDTFQIKNAMVFDLTAMFGTTIANYVNTLETQTAGSGIAWLKSYGFFTEDYYAYSANTIQSVSVSAKVNKDSEDTTISTVALDHTTLRGLFKLDANNNLYADGDVYPSDGSGEVNYAEYDFGDLEWIYETSYTYPFFKTTISGITLSSGWLNAICDAYGDLLSARTGSNYRSNDYNKQPSLIYGQGGYNFAVQDTSYTNANTFKTAMTGKKIIVKIDTPTTATLTPYTSLQNIEQGGTEEFIDYKVQSSTRDVAIPAGNETAYGDNENMGKIINYMNT